MDFVEVMRKQAEEKKKRELEIHHEIDELEDSINDQLLELRKEKIGLIKEIRITSVTTTVAYSDDTLYIKTIFPDGRIEEKTEKFNRERQHKINRILYDNGIR